MNVNYTENYEIFKNHFFNRDIQKRNLERIKCSLSKYNLLKYNPIICTSDLQVIDGNHRLNAARELKIGVWYVILDNFQLEMMINLNYSLSKWSNYVFLLLYEKMGKEEYIKLKKFMDDFKIKIELALPLTYTYKHRRGMNDTFRQGNFIFNNESEVRHKVAQARNFLDYCKGLGQLKITPHNKVPFYDAYFKLMDRENFNQERILAQAKKFGINLLESANLTNYYNQLVVLYERR